MFFLFYQFFCYMLDFLRLSVYSYAYMDESEIYFLTVNEFANRLSVQPRQIYIWIKEGKVHGLRLNDKQKSPWRIPKTELYRLQELAYED